MLKLKVIKSKEFTANDKSQTHYTCAYKGRVFGFNTMRWEGEESNFEVNGSVLTIKTDVEVLKNVATDQLTGKTTTFLDIVPKVDLALAEF